MSLAYKVIKQNNKSLSKDKILKKLAPTYTAHGRTKQSFKDSCDINKLLEKAQQLGSISHLEKHGAFYGDFANAPKDLFEAREMLDRGKAIFADLPAEVRKDFENDPIKFFNWAGGKSTQDLAKELPEIAKPGSYFPDVSAATPPDALLGDTPAAPSSAPTAPPIEPDSGSDGA